MSNPFADVEHDNYDDHPDDAVEKEDDLPDPSELFVPSKEDENADVAP
jgi:hypothetical protein